MILSSLFVQLPLFLSLFSALPSPTDAYFRIDYFLNTIMPTLPTSRLLLGRICPDVDIGSDLWRLNNLFFNQTDRMVRDPKNARNQMVAFPYGAGWAVSSDVAELLGALERSNSPIRR